MIEAIKEIGESDITSLQLKIGPRYVKQENGFRPFQRETLETIKDPDIKIITVEAPVGSGKSYIIRNLIDDEFFKRKPIILTYPTKILMDSQIGSIRTDIKNVSIWPFNQPTANTTNVFYYSSSSLIKFLTEHKDVFELQKSHLINEMIREFGYLSTKSLIVTSPDVLHLLVNRKAYKGSKRIQNLLNGSYVFFDEFHLYSNLKNFPILIENLLKGMASKIVFLSATPFQSEEMDRIVETYPTKNIGFGKSVGNHNDLLFNYPLDVEICSFNYTNPDETFEQLREMIPGATKPMAIIFDSVFRLQKIKRKLENQFVDDFKILEWSGFRKDEGFSLDDKTIVLGTSSIEVGIDMRFETLITEVSYWTSAIQRIGRVGRKSPGKVYVFTKKNFFPYIKSIRVFKREDFESNVLKSALNSPSGRLIAGEMFRGDSYNFLVLDDASGLIHCYSEAIFAMFNIMDYIEDWRELSTEEKKRKLEEWDINKEQTNYFILQDRVFPFWSLVRGRLKNRYSRISMKYLEDEKELHILTDSGEFTFYDKGWLE